MKLIRIPVVVLIVIIGIFFLVECKTDNYNNIPTLGREPNIEPDYSGVTIPSNIAPTSGGNAILLI